VVEGWIGPEGIRNAHREFERGDYQNIVAASSLSDGRWSKRRRSFAAEIARNLLNSGIPPGRIIIAPPRVTVGQCANEAAEAVWRAMRDRNIRPKAPKRIHNGRAR